MTAQLEVRNVTVAYDGTVVVDSFSFELAKGQIGCLLGPSGCGKTTLLRAIAGFEPIRTGEIHLHGRLVSRKGWELPPEKRGIGMVFQDFALFPHLSISDNIAFGIRRLPDEQQKARVSELLELVGLPGLGNQYPHQLSGGQQQRIALARAIAPRPEALLLDEPFSSMDTEMREQLARELRSILKHEGITAVMVTHDQFEAFAMADEIGVMNKGQLSQWATGYDLYHQPADRFVADFIGHGVLLQARVIDEHKIATEFGTVEGVVPDECCRDCPLEILVRPDDIIHDDDSGLEAEVMEKAFRGAEFLYKLKLTSGAEVLCLAPSHHDHAIGSHIGIRLEIDHLVMFRRDEHENTRAC